MNVPATLLLFFQKLGEERFADGSELAKGVVGTASVAVAGVSGAGITRVVAGVTMGMELEKEEERLVVDKRKSAVDGD